MRRFSVALAHYEDPYTLQETDNTGGEIDKRKGVVKAQVGSRRHEQDAQQ